MSSWGQRLYQRLSVVRPSPGQRRRQLLRRILRAGPRYGFESPPAAAASSVLVAWGTGPAGELSSPSHIRAALVANFVLLINRAFGHNADAVASVPPASAAADDGAHLRRLADDVEMLGLQRCRLEPEDCYAREAPRLARVLRDLNLSHDIAGGAWCEPRHLSDLLAALARIERIGGAGPDQQHQRLHWVAGPHESGRLADLCRGLAQLGYADLAAPLPWQLHVNVGPVTLPTLCRRLDDFLALTASRDDLLLGLLGTPRALPVARLSPTAPSASELRQCWLRLCELGCRHDASALALRLRDDEADDARFVEDHNDDRVSEDLVRHLAAFPSAAAAAHLHCEPAAIVAYVAGLVRRLAREHQLLAGGCAAAPAAVAAAAASAQVLESSCRILGLGWA